MATMSVKSAAIKLKFPGGQNALFKFLRKHAGFQGTIAPYSLVFQGFFKVIDREFDRGGRTHRAQTTKVTTEGLSYIADLMSKHLTEKEKE